METRKRDFLSRDVFGVMCAMAAVCAWAAWLSFTRLGVTASLAAQDITFLRFATSGLILLPVVIKNGIAIEKVGLFKLSIIVGGAGVPFVLVASTGLQFTSASHAGAIMPSATPIFVAVLSSVLLKEKFDIYRRYGYGLIVIGILFLFGVSFQEGADRELFGFLLLLVASLMWSSYTVALRTSGLDALHASAVVSTISCVILLPGYAIFSNGRILDAPWTDVLLQVVLQGVLMSVVTLSLFGKAISILGASKASTFTALVPPIGALLAIVILGEAPRTIEWIAIALVSSGAYLASGQREMLKKIK